MATIKKFEDLEVWQIARELCRFVFQITSKGLFVKDFELKKQIRESSGSSMDNIAEGFGRSGKRELIQFLSIANGSANEVKSQLYRARDQDYVDDDEFKTGYDLTNKLCNKIGGFIKYLNSSEHKGEKFKDYRSASIAIS